MKTIQELQAEDRANYATMAELAEAKAYVDDRLEHRTFAEHPEDRIELMHQSTTLEMYITRYCNISGRIILPLPDSSKWV
jgi:hypothetical protein